MKKIVTLALIAGLSGCATAPSKIQASYVSPIRYKALSCAELNQELVALNARVYEVTGQQRKAATTDAVMTGVGIVLFWPALFLLAATPDKQAELGRLKGEFEAVEAASIAKNCKPVTLTNPKPTPSKMLNE